MPTRAHTDPDAIQGRSPWDKRPSETGEAFRAFTGYRDLPRPRRLKRAAVRFYRPDAPPDEVQAGVCSVSQLNQIRRWSAEHDWIARADAWDAVLDQEHVEGMREAEREYTRRAITIAKLGQNVAVRRIQAVIASGEQIAMRDAVRLLALSMQLEASVLDRVNHPELSRFATAGRADQPDEAPVADEDDVLAALTADPDLAAAAAAFSARLAQLDVSPSTVTEA